MLKWLAPQSINKCRTSFNEKSDWQRTRCKGKIKNVAGNKVLVIQARTSILESLEE